MDYVGYLRKLEKVIIKTLFKYTIGGGQIKGQTGVWVQGDVPSRCIKCPPDLFKTPAKIASIGVRVDARGISRHGFALNVDPDMAYWQGIVACGLENQNKCSMAYFLDPVPGLDEVAGVLVEAFSEVFEYEMQAHEGVILL
jgi:lipoate-protein ligase B